ncbi:MAG: GreA/GreB family elongation factor [Steroidobacteraceae bacterium]|jgi:regulator of nucleoside diphosphate kinase|nr:GreA/GreB family elongation factor [Steroidobacteraceae bacterium]
MAITHEIRLTELDAVRLERALMQLLKTSATEPQGAAELELLLDDAAVVTPDSIDPEVVTMNSTVVLESSPSGERTTLTLVYPKDVDPDQSRVSVLSPVGRALIGAHVGDLIRVVVPGHGEREFVLAELTYQPEANGRFDL